MGRNSKVLEAPDTDSDIQDKWDGKFYREHSIAQEDRALKILSKYSFRGDERVLDIGCGDGRITKMISENLPRGSVVGIDLSPSMLHTAISAFCSHTPNLTFLQRDAENFSFARQFDLIVSFATLHWVKDHHAVLRNVCGCLKRGGKIIFMMTAQSDSWFDEVLNREPWFSLTQHRREKFREITVEYYRDLLPQFGLVPHIVKTIESLYTFDDLDTIAHNLMAWLPYATELPKGKCQQLAEEMAINIGKRAGTNKNIPVTRSILHVEAHLE